MAGAELLGLAGEHEVGCLHRGFDGLGAMAGNDDDAAGTEPGGGLHDMLQ